MRDRRRLVSLLVVAIVGGRLSSAAAQGTCMQAEGQMVLQRASDGCASPIDVCLKGTVGAKGGFLDGATWFFTALGQSGSGSKAALVGQTVITARTGILTTSSEASLDKEAGKLNLIDRVTAGRVMEPRLMGAREIFEKGKGVLSANGSGSLDSGFQTDVRGEICLEK